MEISFLKSSMERLRPTIPGKNKGFTLVELMVALALTGIAIGAIYKTFLAQQKIYIAQDQIALVQQDLRAAINIMSKEIRMAGYDPTSSGSFGFISMPSPGTPGYGRFTSADSIGFYTDRNSNGTVDSSDSEQIAFRVNVDQNGNKLSDSARDFILRKYSPGAVKWQPFLDNIDAVGFAYAYDNNNDRQLDNVPGGGTIWAIDSSSPTDGSLDLNLDTNNDGNVDIEDDVDQDGDIDENDEDDPDKRITSPVSLDRVRAIKIWVLARSKHEDRNFINNQKYTIANKILQFKDHYRRRLTTTIIKCRNLGL